MNYIAIASPLLLIFVIASSIYAPNNKIPVRVGLVNGMLSELKKTPNGIASQTIYDKKRVDALPMKSSSDATIAALISASQQTGKVKVSSQTEIYLHLVFTTKLMRFKDDVEFLIDIENNLVQVRSESRTGKSDLGANLKRFKKLRELYLQIGN